MKNKLKLLPNCFLKLLTILFPSRKEYIEYILLDKFLEKTDFDEMDITEMKKCLIVQGESYFPLFHMYFLENMLSNIVYCLYKGYIPMIAVKNDENINLWNQFLLQPYLQDENTEVNLECDVTRSDIRFPNFPTSEDVKKYGKLYKSFVNLNEKTKEYFDAEVSKILNNNERIVGVLCRGTDYTANKPKGHPIQPEIDEIINMVKEKMTEYKCTKIYLATEENKIYKIFEKEFPNQILTNKRNYFDEFYKLKESGKELTRISWVHFDRDNDTYYKSLEYFSSVNILSKCNILIAGNCGGSRTAIYLNENKYEFSYLFNKGVY